MVSRTESEKSSSASDETLGSKGQGQPASQPDGHPVLDISIQKHSRKRTKHGRYISDITLDEILQYVHYPASSACLKLGLGLTSFKRLCRGLGIQSWPYKAGSRPKEEASDGMQKEMQQQDGSNPEVDGFGHRFPGMALSPSGPADLREGLIGGELPSITIDGAPPGTSLSMRVELLKIMQFSTEMKKSVGFTIINDAVVESLYKTACDAYSIEKSRKAAIGGGANMQQQQQQQHMPAVAAQVQQPQPQAVQERQASPAPVPAGVENPVTSTLP